MVKIHRRTLKALKKNHELGDAIAGTAWGSPLLLTEEVVKFIRTAFGFIFSPFGPPAGEDGSVYFRCQTAGPSGQAATRELYLKDKPHKQDVRILANESVISFFQLQTVVIITAFEIHYRYL